MTTKSFTHNGKVWFVPKQRTADPFAYKCSNSICHDIACCDCAIGKFYADTINEKLQQEKDDGLGAN